MRSIKKALWLLLALAFLLEAWAWAQLQPLLHWLGRVLPWAQLRARAEAALSRLPAWAALLAFIVPFACVEPLKLVSLWLLAQGKFKSGVLTFIVAHLLTAGLSLFLFDILRPKLMTIGWFATGYGWLMRLHAWALEQTAPLRARLRAIAAKLRLRGGGVMRRLVRRMRLLRARIRRGGGSNHTP